MSQNMGQTNQHIHCSIDNCQYYDEGNICVASEIFVVSDRTGAEKPDSYDHKMASSAPREQAQSCMDTCCKTFVPKESDKIKEDKATRLKK